MSAIITRSEIVGLRPLDPSTDFTVGVIGSLIAGGFPNPGEEIFRPAININEILNLHPTCTYVGTAWSDSMENLIYAGATLIVDTSVEIRNGHLVAGTLDGDWIMKRFWRDARGAITLHSENPSYSPITIREGNRFELFGKITKFVQTV